MLAAVLRYWLLALLVGAVAAVGGEAELKKYVVSFESGHVHSARHLQNDFTTRSAEFETLHEYSIGEWYGACYRINNSAKIALEQDPRVRSIHESRQVRPASLKEQRDAPWGLASLRYPNLPVGNTFLYDQSAGEGTWAYIIDAGVNVDLDEFEGRASHGYDYTEGDYSVQEDWFEHGTMVASVVASKTYGVAKKASVIDVKYSNRWGYGDHCSILSALDWAVRDIMSNPDRAAKSVINLSSAFTDTMVRYVAAPAFNDAFDATYKAGVLVVVAAGNENSLLDIESPSSVPSMITVGAIDRSNRRSPWSNYGPLIDLFAPGENVLMLNKTGFKAYNSGTSFAAPHVAGLALLLKSKEELRTPRETTARILELSRKDIVRDTKGSPNRLAWLGPQDGAVDGDDQFHWL